MEVQLVRPTLVEAGDLTGGGGSVHVDVASDVAVVLHGL
jgi:hypothetical protein